MLDEKILSWDSFVSILKCFYILVSVHYVVTPLIDRSKTISQGNRRPILYRVDLGQWNRNSSYRDQKGEEV